MQVVGFDDAGSRAPGPAPAGLRVHPRSSRQARRFQPVDGADLPLRRLSRGDYELVDVTGDGLPDILQLNGVARYWRNLGGGVFDRPRTMADAPAGLRLADPGVQLLDADGDGRADLLVTTPTLSGYFPLRFGATWGAFRPYRNAAELQPRGPRGAADRPRRRRRDRCAARRPRLECFFNDPRDRLDRAAACAGAAVRRPAGCQLRRPAVDARRHDRRRAAGPRAGPRRRRRLLAEPGPRPVGTTAADGAEPATAVRATTRGGCCSATSTATGWPTSSTSATSETHVGSTAAATAGAARHRPRLPAASGLRTAAHHRPARHRDRRRAVEPRRADGGRPAMYFLDLTGGRKPRLLNEIDNHIGAVTRVGYAPSTRFALADDARPRDPLADPAAVRRPGRGARSRRIDEISGGKLTTDVPLPARLLGRRGTRVPRLRLRRAGRHRDVRRLPRAGLHAEHAVQRGRPAVVLPADADPHLVPPRAGGRREDGDCTELDHRDEYWAGDPTCSTTPTGSAGSCAGCATRPGAGPPGPPRRAAGAARPGAAHRALRAGRLRPAGPPVHGHRARLRPARGAGRGEPSGTGVLRLRGRAADHAVGARRRPDDPVHVHRRPRRVRPARRADHGRAAAPVRVPATGHGGGRARTFVPDGPTVLAPHTRTEYARPAPGAYIHDRVAQVRAYELPTRRRCAEHRPATTLRAVLADQVAAPSWSERRSTGWHAGDVRLIGHVVSPLRRAGLRRARGRRGRPVTGCSPAASARLHRRTSSTTPTTARRPSYLGGHQPPTARRAGRIRRRPRLPARAGRGGVRGRLVRRHAAAGHDVQTSTAAVGPRGPAARHAGPAAARDHRRPRRVLACCRQRCGTRPAWRPPPSTTTAPVSPSGSSTRTGNKATNYRYHPLGLLATVVLEGRDGEGGTEAAPEIRLRLRLPGDTRPERQPISVHTTARVWHASDGISDEVVESREYSDGFGRLHAEPRPGRRAGLRRRGDDVGLLVRRPDGVSRPVPGQVEGPPPAPDRRPGRGQRLAGVRQQGPGRRALRAVLRRAAGRIQPERGTAARAGWSVLRPARPGGAGRSTRTARSGGPVSASPRTWPTRTTVEPTPWAVTSYDENDLAPMSVADLEARRSR